MYKIKLGHRIEQSNEVATYMGRTLNDDRNKVSTKIMEQWRLKSKEELLWCIKSDCWGKLDRLSYVDLTEYGRITFDAEVQAIKPSGHKRRKSTTYTYKDIADMIGVCTKTVILARDHNRYKGVWRRGTTISKKLRDEIIPLINKYYGKEKISGNENLK